MKEFALPMLVLCTIGNCIPNKANKHKPWIEAEYQGIVMENDRTVLLNPPLFAIDKDAPLHYAGEICAFKIHGQNVPFEAVVLDKITGEGLIRAKEPVDCESQKEHTFTIQAQDCGEGPEKSNVKRSHKAVVHVRVNDVNEFVPVFVERLYRVALNEGKVYERALKVEAVDGDCSPQYSQICFYEILTAGVPFSIDNDGNIKNTEKLDAKKQSLYTFSVTAYDCGKKRAAEDAQVEIEVKPTCRPAWLGWSKRVEYVPGSRSKALFPHIRLETCDEAVWDIEAIVELQTNHVAKGCDRDNYSERTLRKICGAIPGELDLLPPPSALSNWTQGLSTYYSQDTSQIYWFNGSRSARVPDHLLRPSLADLFTLSYWLKHGIAQSKETEAIICTTMATDTGFAHYALTIHGCRMGFLYWPEVANARPVKFLWRLEQVCDGQWHHYALNLQFPTVTLYVDGVTYDPSIIHDSGLLRPPKPEARVIIAACWEDEPPRDGRNLTDSNKGSEVMLDRFLQGFLAGFTLRPGALEPREVLECLFSCKEGLDFSDFESLGKGMKVHINPSQTLLAIQGDDIENFNRAIEHVTYRNALRFATPGVRPLKLSTSLKCFSEESCVSIPIVEGYVVVLQPDSPRISLSGTQHLARPAGDFESPGGVDLFPDIRITCSIAHDIDPSPAEDDQSAVQDSLISDEIIHSLDSCEVFVLGEELNPQRESLLLDRTVLRQKGLEVTNSSSVLTISGVETIAVYELVLRGIRYQVAPEAALFERKFRLVCAEMNGRYISNEFSLEVNVLHSLSSQIHPNHVQFGHQFMHPGHRDQTELTGHRLASTHRSSVIPGAATVIIVVCVGFLVLMVVLGIFRIQTIHQRTPQDSANGKESETFWDDSALTIIVNPMESYEGRQCEGEVGGRDPATSAPSAPGHGEVSEQRPLAGRKEACWERPRRSY